MLNLEPSENLKTICRLSKQTVLDGGHYKYVIQKNHVWKNYISSAEELNLL